MPKATRRINRYASYARCSTDDQAEGDYSTIDSQHDATTRYIHEHIEVGGGEFAGRYSDEGFSGRLTERPGIKSLLADVRTGKVNVVVVTFMNRLGRGPAFSILEYLLQEAGASVHLTQQRFGNDIAGYFARQGTSMMDGFYPLVMSAAVKQKQATMVQNGYWCGGIPAFGLTTEIVPGMVDTEKKKAPRHLIADEATLPFLTAAFEIFDQTESIAQVKRYLCDVAGDKRQWTFGLVAFLLTNEVYRGVLIYGENRNEAAHEPFVPVILFDRVQEKMQRVKEEHNSGGDISPNKSAGYAVSQIRGDENRRTDGQLFYLRGKVKCAVCDRFMTPKGCKGMTGYVGYYECTTSAHGDGKCPLCRVNAYALHQIILCEIAEAAKHPSRFDYFIRETVKRMPPPEKHTSTVTALRAEEKRIDAGLERLTRAISQGSGAVKTLVAEIRRLEQEKDKVSLQRLKAEEMARNAEAERPDAQVFAAAFEHFTESWGELDEEERGIVLPSLIESVVMLEKNKGEVYLNLGKFATSRLSQVRNSVQAGSPNPYPFE